MQKRWLAVGLLMLVMVSLFAVFGQSAAQDDLIPSEQTVQAAVQHLFTETVQAEAYSTYALTVEAEFNAAQTATADALNAFPSPTVSPSVVVPDPDMTATEAANRENSLTAFPTVVLMMLSPILTPLQNIPGGTFEMGTSPAEIGAAVQQCVDVENGNCTLEMGEDSIPPHSVTVASFQLDVTEVTYLQYVTFLNTLGAGNHLFGCDNHICAVTRQENELSNIGFTGQIYTVFPTLNDYPVTDVTWYGAKAYCEAVGERLPTEAEWEYAARGPQNFVYPWGDIWSPDLARTSIPVSEDVGAMRVSSYPSNAYGLYDMAGNVAEWVADWYDPNYYAELANQDQPIDNPSGPISGTERVIRGGSWDAKPFFARSVHRQSAGPDTANAWLGFRCASGAAPTATPTTKGTDNFVPSLVPSPTATLPKATLIPPMTPTFTPTPSS